MMKYIAALTLLACPALSEDALWPDLKEELFGDRSLHDGASFIAIEAPHRTMSDLRTNVGAYVQAPRGLNIGKLWVILDENPMPVSAIFEFDSPQSDFFFNTTMRINRGTPLHIVMETTDSQLFVADQMIKTSGTGACAAPPGTDPEKALATLGEMEISTSTLPTRHLQALGRGDVRMDLDILHPSHSGMQKDQISLLYIPMRYVETVDFNLDQSEYVEMTGSISLSENPQISISVPRGAELTDVTLTDTEGSVSSLQKSIAIY